MSQSPFDTENNFLGFPIVESKEVPENTIIFGPSLPQTQEELISDGCVTLEEWIHKHAEEFTMIKNIGGAK